MKNDDSIGYLGYWSAVAIGIGGMVGGGIFAVLGLAVELARGGTPVAFALAGAIAMVTSYSYAKMSVAYPSQGGTVEFLNQAFGPGLITGGLNILLWLSYIVVLSLYAYTFGSYGSSFFLESIQPVVKHILISVAVILLTLLNVLSAKIVGESEEFIVALKITILLVFIGFGIGSVDPSKLTPSTWTAPLNIITGGMIIFVAYEGFELIANTAGDIRNPKKTLPAAYYTAVGFVILLYIIVAVVTVGNLPFEQIIKYKDYALAAAAKPFLGMFGFTMIGIAALLSTGSAINATLYGASRFSYIIAKDGELPKALEKKIWNRPLDGLFITSGLTLLIANLFDLSSIATMGSAGFLIIFGMVNAANVRLARMTESLRWLSLIGLFFCIFALGALIWQRATTNLGEVWVLVVMVGLAFLIEGVYRRVTGRQLKRLS
jgi:amino acid transporter